ncbi:MAG: iron-containing alcohol dehydrogenase [Anaeromyxobacteraceae bacterium]
MTASQTLSRFVAPEILSGEGALRLTGRTAANLGARRVLLVTDPGVEAAGWADEVERSLAEAGLERARFDGVSPNPRASQSEAGAARYAADGCNVIVAVGGGSVIDCAKGIGIVASNGGDVLSFEGFDQLECPIPPLVCVPTTAGSAADVSQFAIINDERTRTKLPLVSKALVPDVSLLDPVPLLTQPAALTFASGVDALSHAVEALFSTGASPLTTTFAEQAIRLSATHLPRALERPGELEERSATMEASLLAGLAFSNASLGAGHALAHALGGRWDGVHGEYNAVLLPHVVRYNAAAAPGPTRQLGVALGLDLAGCPEAELGERVAGALAEFLARLGTARGLGALGVGRASLPALAATALEDPCMATNPRCPAPGELEALLEAAF